MAVRFGGPVSGAEEVSLRAGAIPTNTKATTDWGICVWTEWAASRATTIAGVHGILPLTTLLLNIPHVNIAYWMEKFVLEVHKKDGSEYPPKCLHALVCCFKRFFEENGVHNVNLLNIGDSRFGNFRATLNAEMKHLHGKGLGTSSKQPEPIIADGESLLWTSGQFGTHRSKALLNTVYFYNCKVFGLRSYDEHRNLSCSQFAKKLDEKGRVYIEYTDFGSKTNRGGLKHMKVQNKTIRQYENPDDADHCVVNLFVKYFDFIPNRDRHFYFRSLPNNGSGIPKFGKQPIGIH